MKRLTALILSLVMITAATACQTTKPVKPTENADQMTAISMESTSLESGSESQTSAATETTTVQSKIEPFSARRFIFTNGLAIENKQVSKQANSVNIEQFYPEISGIKNRTIEDLLNNEILNTMSKLMQDLESSAKIEAGTQSIQLNTKVSNVSVVYNCNNVIFIEFYAYLDASIDSGYISRQKTTAFGMDLNSGRKLELKDLFIRNIDFEQLINNYIVLYIIGNNFDDPDAQFMTKPFQGIRGDQAFSFDLTGLRVLLDEKNDEFVNSGYTQMITVPFKDIAGDLAVFDSFYDSETNLFAEPSKKQLLPNRLEYHIDKVIQDAGNNFGVYIETGTFLNLDDPHLQDPLNQLTGFNLDHEGFKQRALAFAAKNPGVYYGNMNHTVGLTMNAGGYLSILVYDVVYEKEKIQDNTRIFNYDFNLKHSMKLADLFINGFDYRSAIGAVLQESDSYYLPDGTSIKASDIQSISEDDFYFDQYGINVNLARPGSPKIETYVWVPYEKLGWENIAMFR